MGCAARVASPSRPAASCERSPSSSLRDRWSQRPRHDSLTRPRARQAKIDRPDPAEAISIDREAGARPRLRLGGEQQLLEHRAPWHGATLARCRVIGDNGAMPLWPTNWFYRRLGPRYPTAVFLAQLSIGAMVTAGTLVLLSAYYDATWDQRLRMLAIAEAATLAGLTWGYLKSRGRLVVVREWIAGRRDEATTLKAWDAAVNLPIRVFRNDVLKPSALLVIVGCIAATDILDLSWTTFFPLAAGASIAVAYTAILQYFAMETALRPVIAEMNEHFPEEFDFARIGLPLKLKLMTILPLINVITGLVVAAVTSGGGSSLGLSVLAATGVAFTLSLELSVLLSMSVMRPVWALRDGLEAVRRGHYDVRVPVTTSDELGELAAGFNEMARGLAERERLREAFGTYVDRDVAEHIMSSGFSESGEAVVVSVLFCDVRGFTRYAAEADPKEVVAALNELFGGLVPIVARHGGHVDKFVGDGLLAVFGARTPRRPCRPRAGCGLRDGRSRQRRARGVAGVGAGINSGRVVAGSIGGGGRLNFSVIGDTVNVAARVEAATRETGDDILVTRATCEALLRPVETVSRGVFELKGRDEPLELFAPAAAARPRSGAAAGAIAARRAERPRAAPRRTSSAEREREVEGAGEIQAAARTRAPEGLERAQTTSVAISVPRSHASAHQSAGWSRRSATAWAAAKVSQIGPQRRKGAARRLTARRGPARAASPRVPAARRSREPGRSRSCCGW